ncbi:MAG: glycosyltransferase [Candidatus Bathyarchaeia archaeon]
MNNNIIVISTPVKVGGGGSLRAFRSIKAYCKKFNTYLFIPHDGYKYFAQIKNKHSDINELIIEGVRIFGYSKLKNFIYKLDHIPKIRVFTRIMPLAIPKVFVLFKFAAEKIQKPKVVISLHECLDSLYAAVLLSKAFNCKSLALLQLPPFYGSKKRISNILEAYKLWCDVLLENKTKAYAAFFFKKFLDNIHTHNAMKLLNKFSRIIAVSKSIPYEMGPEWISKIIALDPGVSLDEEDEHMINLIRNEKHVKKDYVIFGGRPGDAFKGLIEALIVFKTISKENPNLKLICTGNIGKIVLARINKFCHKLKINDKVVFMGFKERFERFKFVAESKLMLYPSHMDAFSYAVLESLCLGTPVVGYKIPALETYYNGLQGVKLVEEGDIETLAIEALNMLKEKCEVEKPQIRKWKDIMNEEIKHIEELLC